MKRIFALASASLAFAAAVACATSQDEPQPVDDAGSTSLPDSGDATAPITDGGVIEDSKAPGLPECSDAGWCTTPLPDVDLTLRDIWPFEKRAFAITESLTLGVKILEWTEADAKWAYIDDNTQNEYGLGQYAGKLWAPNENEIYYGVAPSLIYYGKRAAPGSPWTWERTALPNNSLDTNPAHDPGVADYQDQNQSGHVTTTALGVWGVPGGTDVYAWYGNTIFRLESGDGGAKTWAPDYVFADADSPSDVFYVFGASGSSNDDVWFAAGRGRYDGTAAFACPIALHKTPAGYARLIDNDINDSDHYNHYADSCQPKVGTLGLAVTISFPPYGTFVVPWTNGGWLANVESAGPSVAVGVFGGKFIAYLSASGTDANDAGASALNLVNITVPRAFVPAILNSVWVNGADTWLSGWGLLLHVDTDPGKWSTGLGISSPHDDQLNQADASTYGISTTVLNGGPLDRPLYQVRGTSNSNLWAIGPRYALHKTTP